MKTGIILLAVIWFSGCALTQPTPPVAVTVAGPERQLQDAAVSVNEKRYKEASATYNKIIAEAPESLVAADAWFELSLVSVYSDNPQKDYAQASRAFSEFVKRYPDHRRTEEARSWISVLKTIHELKKQNESYSKKIEELQQLDIRHEEKRTRK